MSKVVDSSSLSQLFSNVVDSNSAEVSGIFKKLGAF
jgi:hypothetical protein